MRIDYWDNWKGIAIIAVIAIHASGTTSNFSAGSFNWDFGLVFRSFINFAVPIFFGLAGYFAARYLHHSAASLYKARIGRILYPYAAWSILYLLIRTPTELPGLNEISQGLLLGKAIGIGYFVIVLLQFTILTPLYNIIDNKKTHILIIIIGTIAAVTLNYGRLILPPSNPITQFPQNAILFIFWYPFFHLGYFIARYKVKLNLTSHYILIPLALCLAIVESLFWGYNDNYSFGVSQLKLTSFILSALIFLFIVENQHSPTLHSKSLLTWIGTHSYAIYLIHMIALSTTKTMLNKIPGLQELQPIYISSATIITAILTCTTIVIIKLILPKNMHGKILG